MMRTSTVFILVVVLLASCGGNGPEAAGESVPRVDQTQDSTGSGN